MSRAMLMPLERMRIGINSESASHAHTPGPIAKKAANEYKQTATSQPLSWSGTGMISALSILNDAVRAASRLANGLEKNATVLLAGTQLFRVISMGLAEMSSERATGVAAQKWRWG